MENIKIQFGDRFIVTKIENFDDSLINYFTYTHYFRMSKILKESVSTFFYYSIHKQMEHDFFLL